MCRIFVRVAIAFLLTVLAACTPSEGYGYQATIWQDQVSQAWFVQLDINNWGPFESSEAALQDGVERFYIYPQSHFSCLTKAHQQVSDDRWILVYSGEDCNHALYGDHYP